MLNKHLSQSDRLEIEKGLNVNLSFKHISNNLNKHCSTISREIRNHYIVKNIGSVGRKFNNCVHRRSCPNRGKNCKIHSCSEFQEELCSKLKLPPYVCNGCKRRTQCTYLNTSMMPITLIVNILMFYLNAEVGVIIDTDEIDNLNTILVPLIRDQHQSIHHAIINNKNTIMHSEKTIYKLINLGLLKVKNIDLHRKVRFRARKKNSTVYKVDKCCLDGRRYEDYLNYIKENPDISIVQMDTVEGRKGGKVLLTIHFVESSFMLAFIREHNDSQSIINIFNFLFNTLGKNNFLELFPLLLTDNGCEFSNPTEIEFDRAAEEVRTKVFYCHPSCPHEKGACEVNHEILRRVFPKGTSFDALNQNDINLVMSHVNSYQRKKLNNKSPHLMFSSIYGKVTLDKLGILEIDPNNVSLSKSILKREAGKYAPPNYL